MPRASWSRADSATAGSSLFMELVQATFHATCLSMPRRWRSGRRGAARSAFFTDSLGNRMAIGDSFFPIPAYPYQRVGKYSDFGVGWRISPDFFFQYVYSTDYGYTPASHMVMCGTACGFGASNDACADHTKRWSAPRGVSALSLLRRGFLAGARRALREIVV